MKSKLSFKKINKIDKLLARLIKRHTHAHTNTQKEREREREQW